MLRRTFLAIASGKLPYVLNTNQRVVLQFPKLTASWTATNRCDGGPTDWSVALAIALSHGQLLGITKHAPPLQGQSRPRQQIIHLPMHDWYRWPPTSLQSNNLGCTKSIDQVKVPPWRRSNNLIARRDRRLDAIGPTNGRASPDNNCLPAGLRLREGCLWLSWPF